MEADALYISLAITQVICSPIVLVLRPHTSVRSGACCSGLRIACVLVYCPERLLVAVAAEDRGVMRFLRYAHGVSQESNCRASTNFFGAVCSRSRRAYAYIFLQRGYREPVPLKL